MPDPFGGNYHFSRLARATGGKSLYGRNDVDAEIGTAHPRRRQLLHAHLSAHDDHAWIPQKFRKIKVTVDRPGLTVTTRQGYFVSGARHGSIRPHPRGNWHST